MKLQYPALKARLKQVIGELERLRTLEREVAMKEIRRLLSSVDLSPGDLRRLLQSELRRTKNASMRGTENRKALLVAGAPLTSSR